MGNLSIVIHTSEVGKYFSLNYDTTKNKNGAQAKEIYYCLEKECSGNWAWGLFKILYLPLPPL